MEHRTNLAAVRAKSVWMVVQQHPCQVHPFPYDLRMLVLGADNRHNPLPLPDMEALLTIQFVRFLFKFHTKLATKRITQFHTDCSLLNQCTNLQSVFFSVFMNLRWFSTNYSYLQCFQLNLSSDGNIRLTTPNKSPQYYYFLSTHMSFKWHENARLERDIKTCLMGFVWCFDYCHDTTEPVQWRRQERNDERGCCS